MSKKYKGKTCVYCATAVADGADHVFAREFFLHDERTGLPKVPACDRCNGEKSILEHYATTVLPFGGRHTSALENFRTMVPRRLERNPPLHRDILAGMQPVQWIENGAATQTALVPIDADRLHQLLGLIARGLCWHHFGLLVPSSHVATATTLTREGAELFESDFFGPNKTHAVVGRVGKDTVVYQGLHVHGPPEDGSIWRIRLYGGMQLISQEAPELADPAGATFGVITGPADLAADAFGT